MPRFTIGTTTITQDSGPYVVAELSHNHNGQRDLASRMIEVAAECGVNAVKLQKRSPAFYAALRAKGMTDYADIREKRELTESDYIYLGSLAHARHLAFIATAFDLQSLEFLQRTPIDAVKLASGALHNIALVYMAARVGLPVVMSIGCSGMEDIQHALEAIPEQTQTAILQCTSVYPCPPEHMHLKFIRDMCEIFDDSVIGFSSHALDNRMEPAAFALGARVFEKHFTLSKHLGAGDHAMSLEPDGLRDLVDVLHATKAALGDGRKQFLPCEEVGRSRLDLGYTPKREAA